MLFTVESGMLLGRVEMGSEQFLLRARAQFLYLCRANNRFIAYELRYAFPHLFTP